jgi:uncharacterized membrane protein
MHSTNIWWIAAVGAVILIAVYLIAWPGGGASDTGQPSPHALDQSN